MDDDNFDAESAGPDRRNQIRISPQAYDLLTAASKHLNLSHDDILVSALGELINRNKTAFNVEVAALIQEIRMLRQTLEAIGLTNLELSENLQLLEAARYDTVAALIAELGAARKR